MKKYSNNYLSIWLLTGVIILTLVAWVKVFSPEYEAIKAQEKPNLAPSTVTSTPVELIPLTSVKPEIEVQIREIAREENFPWPDYLVRLAERESSLNPAAISKPNRNGSIDYGLFQWNSKLPPLPITRECAMDLDCSTRMTIKAINLGMQDHWTTNESAKK